MKNKKTLLILILVFIVLIGGAYALYNRLGQNVATDQLVVKDPGAQEDEKAQTEQKNSFEEGKQETEAETSASEKDDAAAEEKEEAVGATENTETSSEEESENRLRILPFMMRMATKSSYQSISESLSF